MSLPCHHVPHPSDQTLSEMVEVETMRGELILWTLCDSQDVLLSLNRVFQMPKGLPRRLRGKESAWQCRDVSLIPGSRRSPGGGHSNPLQCSCLENPMDRGAWQVYSVAKSWTQLKRQCTHTHTHTHSYLTHKTGEECYSIYPLSYRVKKYKAMQSLEVLITSS